MRNRRDPFLTARWEKLVVLNWVCPQNLLAPLIPSGVELDLWEGSALVSMVGFTFSGSRVKGFPIPGANCFPEVNLRFYVKRVAHADQTRRGVVFIKELCPNRLICASAKLLYNENYLSVPMFTNRSDSATSYDWFRDGKQFKLSADHNGEPELPPNDSVEQFVIEHYWGYGADRRGSTLEYQVVHPPWRIYKTLRAQFEGGSTEIYGEQFDEILRSEPHSWVTVEGSAVQVFWKTRL